MNVWAFLFGLSLIYLEGSKYTALLENLKDEEFLTWLVKLGVVVGEGVVETVISDGWLL